MAKKHPSSFNNSASVAERAMPGWHAVTVPDRPPVTDAMPGRTLAQLQAKFQGMKRTEPARLVKLARNRAGKGPRETVVLVSGNEVVARQG